MLVRFFIAERNNIKRKDLFWLMVSEFLVHGWLVSLLWSEVKDSIMVTGTCVRGCCSSQGSHEAERDRWEGAKEGYTLQRHATSDLLPPVKPH
jgi:hypothetical protein